MATANFTQSSEHSSDSTFQAWATALSNALGSLSDIVQTSDTGQINTSTASRPSTNSYAGYQIYRFDDAAQSTNPVFIKIEYGTGTVASHPAIRIQVGSGSNGSGTLIGENRMIVGEVASSSNTSTTAVPCYVSAGPGRLDVGMFVNTTFPYMSFGFSISRFLDDSGNPLDEATQVVIFAGSNKKFQQVIPMRGGAFPSVGLTNFQCALPPSGTGSYGGNVGVYPILPYFGYPANPTGICAFFAADITSGSTLSFNMYGSSWDFVAISTLTSFSGINGNSNAAGVILRNQ